MLLGGIAASCLGVLLSLAARPHPAATAPVAAAEGGAYPAAEQAGKVASPGRPGRLTFLAGVVGRGGERADGLEAILRLHAYLALRDVYAGPIALEWEAAVPLEQGPEAIRRACGFDRARRVPPGALLDSGVRPDPLGRKLDPAVDFRMLLQAEAEEGDLRVEAFACPARGTQHSQVFVARSGQEGVVLRELGSWLAAILGVTDPGSFSDSWGREPAPRGPALSTYGGLLARSLDPEGLNPRLQDRPSTSSLLDATQIVPEAAWLAAMRSADPARRRALLRRAAALRVGFTAALEDLAALEMEIGRPDLASATLDRLSADPARQRPVELLLAAGLLGGGRPADCRTLLAGLPRRWRATTSAARLHALALLDLGNPQEAVRWSAAWTDSDPESAEALVVHGRALAGSQRPDEAAGAWRRAARLDSRWRRAALLSWLGDAAPVGSAGDVMAFIDELEMDGVPLESDLLELRAYAALRAGDAVAAAADYSALAERHPDVPRFQLDRCVAALLAGEEGGAIPCAGGRWTALEDLQVRTASASRGVSLPGYPMDVSALVRRAAELAPASPEVQLALMATAGKRRGLDEATRRTYLARWRVAVGPGVPAPEPPEPRGEPG